MEPLDPDPEDPSLLLATFALLAVLSSIVISATIAFWLNGIDLPPLTWVLVLGIVFMTLRAWWAYDQVDKPQAPSP